MSIPDVYNSASKELTTSALEVGGKVYINLIITVSGIVSLGGFGP
jgi:hypothetical protein